MANLDVYQHILWYWYIHQNLTIEQTHDAFHLHLNSNYNGHHQIIAPSILTLQRIFQAWNFRKNASNLVYDHTDLNRELWVHFYHWGLNDSEILSFLHQRGYDISSRG